MYPDSDQAKVRANALGKGYQVRFGSNRYGTNDFISDGPAL